MEQHVWSVLQPIVNLETGRIVGHEALIRGDPARGWATPAALFAWAEAAGQSARVEAACRRKAFEAAVRSGLPDDQWLFVNVNLTTVDIPLDPGGPTRPPNRVAIEISEQQPVLDNRALREQIAGWQQTGYRIVLDDYGSGYMGEGALLALHPHAIKLDRILIHGIDQDRTREKVVRALAGMARQLGICVIAEGIETEAEFYKLKRLGIQYGQGFWLGRPAMEPVLRCRELPTCPPTARPGRPDCFDPTVA